jgi:hypothetical protein
MDVARAARALQSPTRFTLLLILHGESLSSAEAHRRLLEARPNRRHRESTYRDLEIMVAAGLLEKRYDIRSKEIRYVVLGSQVVFDLKSRSVELR